MKKLLLILMLLVSVVCKADTYQILKLSKSPIIIGGEEKVEKQTFTDKETITWKYDNQGMWVRDLTNDGYRYFSKEAFQSAKVSTAYAYLKTNHPSTRDGFELLPYKKSAYDSKKRLALVIGNSNYMYEPSLRNPISDVTDVVDKLRNLGFDVLRAYDADFATINDALEKKFKDMARGYSTILFYYAGHGQQYKGQPYLIPTDVNVVTEYDILNKCIPGPRVVSLLNEANANTNIVIIDACRSEKSLLRSSGSEELRMEAPDNGIVLFSTKSGEPALDGDGTHSPFADAFISGISKVDLSLSDAIAQITKDVKVKTEKSGRIQVPNLMSSLDHIFYFNKNQSQTTTPAVTTTHTTSTPPASTNTKPATTNTQPVSTSTKPTTTTQLKQTSGSHNGHEWVDLGLPSGTKWATCNIGASSPSDYGDYFAWGETKPKKVYNVSNLKYRISGDYKNNNVKFSKYVMDSKYGTIDNKIELELCDDAAFVNWGSGWRMPSKAQQEELRDRCKWTWTTIEGHKGYKVVGKNGNSIFLPAAGSYDGGFFYNIISFGNYWSRTGYDGGAFYLYLISKRVERYAEKLYYGQSVRAVLSPE